MQAFFILNPAAGRRVDNRSLCESAAARFRSQGWQTVVTVASTAREISLAARQALAAKAALVVACGGDGTVGTVASSIAGASTLGVLPLGTLNHFARDLGIPTDPHRAAQILLKGRTRSVDIGQVNGLRFINNSSLGLYPGIVRDREARERSGSSRLFSFAVACAVAFRRLRPLRLLLEIDGQVSERLTPFLFVGNNRYEAEGFTIGRRRRLDEGRLSLYLSHRAGRFGLLRIALAALFHRLRRHRDFVMLPAASVVVRTHRRHIRVALDGEVVQLHPPLRYSIQPGLLKVVVP